MAAKNCQNRCQNVTGSKTIDGVGVHLVRVLGYRTVRDFAHS